MAADSSSDAAIRVARVLHRTTAEGPGVRTAVWVQGCSVRCAGCINPHLFAERGGTSVAASEIIDGAVSRGVEGLTLLGGEPFDQAPALAVLAKKAKAKGLGVICFTGYTESEAARMPGGRPLLEYIDLLIDGPYVSAQADSSRALVGSKNQRFLHLTDRYRDFSPELHANRIDLRISPRGDVAIAGFVDQPQLDELTALLRTRRVSKGPS